MGRSDTFATRCVLFGACMLLIGTADAEVRDGEYTRHAVVTCRNVLSVLDVHHKIMSFIVCTIP